MKVPAPRGSCHLTYKSTTAATCRHHRLRNRTARLPVPLMGEPQTSPRVDSELEELIASGPPLAPALPPLIAGCQRPSMTPAASPQSTGIPCTGGRQWSDGNMPVPWIPRSVLPKVPKAGSRRQEGHLRQPSPSTSPEAGAAVARSRSTHRLQRRRRGPRTGPDLPSPGRRRDRPLPHRPPYTSCSPGWSSHAGTGRPVPLTSRQPCSSARTKPFLDLGVAFIEPACLASRRYV